MCAKKRIALYGGTFDPVHLGHLEVAHRVTELFEIDRVLFIPAQIAPHKLSRAVTAPIHRYAMLVLATQSEPRLLVSTFELDAPDRRYTVDTVAHFQSTFDDSTELFFIMGADSWSEITTWRDWERLLAMTNHIVVARPGYDIAGGETSSLLRDRIIDLRKLGNDAQRILRQVSGERVFITDVVMNDISATEIRRLAKEDRFEDLNTLVPQPVAEYITKYRIYRDSHEA
jgi:nicotinate-nucleotide adenylyltransferase